MALWRCARYLTAPYKDRAVLMAAPAGPRAVKVARRCTLRRKALADVVESLIGSFFEAGGAFVVGAQLFKQDVVQRKQKAALVTRDKLGNDWHYRHVRQRGSECRRPT